MKPWECLQASESKNQREMHAHTHSKFVGVKNVSAEVKTIVSVDSSVVNSSAIEIDITCSE